MQQSGQVRAWRHAYARKGFLNGAGAAYSRAALKYEHALVGTCQVRRAGKAVVAGSHDNHIPAARGQFTDGNGQSYFDQDRSRTRRLSLSIYFGAPSWKPTSTKDMSTFMASPPRQAWRAAR